MKTKKTNCRTGVFIVLLLAVVFIVISAVFKLVEKENKKIAEPRQRVRYAEEMAVVAPKPFRYVVMPMYQEEERAETSGADTEDYDKIYDFVEVMPEFPGGMEELIGFLRANPRYPKEWEEQGFSGRVIVAFVVRRTGKITDARVVKSINTQLDEEALRVINSMPRWTPGKHNGVDVDVKYVLPVIFPPSILREPIKESERRSKDSKPSSDVIN